MNRQPGFLYSNNKPTPQRPSVPRNSNRFNPSLMSKLYNVPHGPQQRQQQEEPQPGPSWQMQSMQAASTNSRQPGLQKRFSPSLTHNASKLYRPTVPHGTPQRQLQEEPQPGPSWQIQGAPISRSNFSIYRMAHPLENPSPNFNQNEFPNFPPYSVPNYRWEFNNEMPSYDQAGSFWFNKEDFGSHPFRQETCPQSSGFDFTSRRDDNEMDTSYSKSQNLDKEAFQQDMTPGLKLFSVTPTTLKNMAENYEPGVLFEVFGVFFSPGGKKKSGIYFRLASSGDDILQCVFYETDRNIPKMIVGKHYRCVGSLRQGASKAQSTMFVYSIRLATEDEIDYASELMVPEP